MKQLYAALFVSSLTLHSGCNDKTPTPETKTNAAGAPDAKAPTTGDKNQCLLDHQNKFEVLLPVELAAEVAGQPADQAEKTYRNSAKHPLDPTKKSDLGFNDLQYAWPSDRTEEIQLGPAKGMKVKAKNIVGFSNMSIMNKTYFDNSYRAMTEQETQDLKKATKERLEKEPPPNASKETTNATAEIMGGAFQEVTAAYREVSDIGEAARWNIIENTLYVLHKGVSFQVEVSVDNSNDKNKELALGLAKKIIEKCP